MEKKRKLKHRMLFNGRVYDREQMFFKTKKEIEERTKKGKNMGFNTIIDKRKEGYFMWVRSKKPNERKLENQVYKRTNMRVGKTIITDNTFGRKYRVVGVYGDEKNLNLEVVDMNDKDLSKGSMSVSGIVKDKRRYNIFTKK